MGRLLDNIKVTQLIKRRICGALPPLPQYSSMEWCSVKVQFLPYLYPPFMEADGSSPCSQDPVSCSH